MAAKKAAEKKVKELWVFSQKGEGETYGTYPSRAKTVEAITEEIQDRYNGYDKSRKLVYQIFKLESEVQFEVEVKEVPTTVRKTVVKEKK